MKIIDYYKRSTDAPDSITLSKEQMLYWLWMYFYTTVHNTKVEAGMDDNAETRALAWKSDADCPIWRSQRINDMLAWGDQIWTIYCSLKLQIQLDDDPDLPETFPPFPHEFVDLIIETKSPLS